VAATSATLRPLPLARLAIPLWRAQQFLASDAAYRYFPWKKAALYAGAAASAAYSLMPGRTFGRFRPGMGGKRLRFGGRGGSSKRAKIAPYSSGNAGGRGSGHYKGALARPTRPPKVGKYALYGHRADLEYHGTTTHDNVTYLGAQSATAARVGVSVGVAFIRMVMKRHYQCEYSNTGQVLQALSAAGREANYFPYSIRFWRKSTPRNSIPVYSVNAEIQLPGQTVLQFAQSFADNVFNNIAFGGGSAGTSPDESVELHAYQFVHLDSSNTGGTLFVNTAVVPLEGQYLTVYSSVRMAIQNVTGADVDDGASKLTTRIDANPVRGKLMRFKDPLPLVKDDRGVDGSATNDFGWKLQQDVNADGIIWPTPLSSPNGPWSQVPTADMFRNCVGVANVSLEPGDIKDYSFAFNFSGTIQALMKGFNLTAQGGQAPLPTSSHQFGTSFLFALEKRMPTGATAVALNFHYENKYGAVFGRRRKTPMSRQSILGGLASADVAV